MIFVLLIITTAFLIVALFAFPRFSPIPYFPSNRKDILLIIESLGLTNNQTVYDLGAGNGTVIFEAAKNAYHKKINTQFVAVEINPVLVAFLHIRRLLYPYKKNVQIVWGDMFKTNLNHLSSKIRHLTFYLYISPWFLEQITKRIRKIHPKARIVSYMYPAPSLKATKILKGKNRIFIYNEKDI